MSVLTFNSTAQHIYYNTTTNVVFEDSTNVRSTASTGGKILGKLRHNAVIKPESSIADVAGVVGDVKSSWIAIKYKGAIGYIWKPKMADGICKSEKDTSVHFLFNFNSRKELEIKVFQKNKLLQSKTFDRDWYYNFQGVAAVGTTYYSNGKEYFAVIHDGDCEVFEWDGKDVGDKHHWLVDESAYTGKYNTYRYAIINADKVNLRVSPNRNASVLATLNNLTKVQVVQTAIQDTEMTYADTDVKFIADTMNGKDGYWIPVDYKSTLGYIWSDFVDVPLGYVKSNKVEKESYLYTTNAFYVLNDTNISYRHPFENPFPISNDNFDKNDLVVFGDRGFGANHTFLGICYTAESCGEMGGDDVYLWDGKKLHFFLSDYSIGDGGYSTEHSYVFPNQEGGKKGRVIYYEGESEYVGEDSENGNVSGVFSSAKYEFQFNGDSLVEVPSIDSKLRAKIGKEFPKNELMHYSFGDLNGDGFSDAVCLLTSKHLEGEEKGDDRIVAIVFGKAKEEFQVVKSNSHLVHEGYHSVGFEFKKDTLNVQVLYHVGMESEYSGEDGAKQLIPHYSKFSFVMDDAKKEIICYSKTEAVDKDLEDFNLHWKVTKKEFYKKNKVLFEKAIESKKFD